MVRRVSEGFIKEIVSVERLAELEKFLDNLGYYETVALGKFISMRRNSIAHENMGKFFIGQKVKIFDVDKGIEYVGFLTKIDGPKSLIETDDGTVRVPTEMLYL